MSALRHVGRLASLNVGAPRSLAWDGEDVTSGIFKEPAEGTLRLTRTGFAEDTQVDTRAHGGPDKAACVFPADHYPHWRAALDRELTPGAFGENLTLSGLSEDDVCAGDVYRLGGAVVQVAQPREPCHKLAKKFQVKDIGPRLLEQGHTGFYFRVLEEGDVTAGDDLHLEEPDPARCSITFMNRIQWASFYHTPDTAERAQRLLEVVSLPERWREICRKHLKGSNPSSRDEG